MAQAVYMPQASAYLPDESDLPTSDDASRLDNSKPETWPLFLPSAIPEDNRWLCHKGVVETERVLRLAQLQDNLVDLRRFRRALRNLRLYFKTNITREGQKTQTKSRTIETGVNNRIKRAVWRYRTAYRALLDLDPTGDWTNGYHELKDEDNRGPLKEAEERGTGDGRYTPSWIWATSSAMVLPGEGSAAEQQEVNETVRYEWMTCRARADRWIEEEELLQEEMRRVIVYLEWKSRAWTEKVGIRAASCTPDIQHGIDAYTRKQANIYHQLAVSFAGQWLPYFKVSGLRTKWMAEFPWASRILSRETKLPKWFPIPQQDTPHTPHIPPAAASCTSPGATGGPGMEQRHPDTYKGQREGYDYEEEVHGAHSNDDGEGSDNDEYPGDEEQDSDYSDKDYDNDYDGESDYDEGHDGDGYKDGAETNDEFGFEYDDDYMS